MINILKSNKLRVLLLFIICIFFIIKPSICSNACLSGVSIWATKVFPMLFPFFIITRIIVSLSDFKPNFMDKFFGKCYNVPPGSFFIFLLSVLCGYPMGAKLISNLYADKKINSNQAKKMMSFCAVSGPMFMVGTVGLSIFNSYKAGLIILIANIISALMNGLIYRGLKEESTPNIVYISKIDNNNLYNIILDSLTSILMVGSYIIISFIFIDIFQQTKIFYLLSYSICKIINCENFILPLQCIFSGIIEITRGCVELNLYNLSLNIKTIIASTIIGFGGISVMLQSCGFLKDLHIKTKHIIIQKLTQASICLIVSIPLSVIFL